jgi:threonine dehydrogenase-like Zn-dependent dehydrogenase
VIKVLVLGCGPAGLLAAERLEREGADVRIAAKKVKSIMPGAQYLHMSIGGVTPQWEERIVDRELSAKIVSVLAAAYDLVISTIPAPFLCLKVCQFNSATVFISRYPRPWVPKNTIVYNGLSKNDWYRTSLIFGHGSTEYAEPPHMIPTIEARKPTGTNCECQPKNVIRLGRFGAWEKAADALHEVQ